MDIRLAPDDTINMVTSERNKTDGKPQLAVHVSPSIKKKIPLQPSAFREFSRLFFSQVDYCMDNVHRKFCSSFGFGSNPKNIYLLIEFWIFRFILIYTWVRGAINECIIIHLTNNHFHQMSVLTFFNRPINILLKRLYIAK